MSEWNKISGNWSCEERDFSKWGKDRLKEVMESRAAEFAIGSTLKVSKVEGDVRT